MEHQLITQAEYTTNLVVHGTFGCVVFVRVSCSASGFQLAACFVRGVYQPAVNLVSIDLIVSLLLLCYSVLSSSLHLNNYILVEGLLLLAKVKPFGAGA